MKKAVISNCEKSFIIKGIEEGKRVDGRGPYAIRNLKVHFGNDRGLCHVQLGSTKVLAQVSCEVVVPAPARPNEGSLYINADLSSLSAPYFDNRPSDYSTEVNRLLERCILESKAVDVETLCIVAREKVWSIRVDARVLNHDGNLIDCLSIAVIASLVHFRRPDVTISGEEVTIHTLEDRNPVPLSVHHWPICMTFAFFEDGKYLLLDPIEREELAMDGKAVLGVNGLKEICSWHMSGTMSLLKDQILRCAQIATSKAGEVIEIIKTSLAIDAEKRASGKTGGFCDIIEMKNITTLFQGPIEIHNGVKEVITIIESDKQVNSENNVISNEVKVIVKAPGTAIIGLGGTSTWTLSDDEEDKIEKPKIRKQTVGKIETVDLSDDSEEDVVMLTGDPIINIAH